jgi:hypothetical protein
MEVNFALLADGGSDRALLPIAKWVFAQRVPTEVQVRGEAADLSVLREPPRKLTDRISRAIELYPCTVLLVHRDAEAQDPEMRHKEIEVACRQVQTESLWSHVCVVPVRMTEAWLLFDEGALRKAAGNPNGKMPLSFPSDPESEPQPKRILLDALREASGLKGHRRKRFRPETARFFLANRIDDFSALRHLAAFRRFEHDVREVLAKIVPSTPAS